MTKEECERLIEWVETCRGKCPCEDCQKFSQMTAELRRTSDYDELREEIAEADRTRCLANDAIAELQERLDAANRLLKTTDDLLIDLLAGIGVRRAAKYLSNDIERHLNAALSPQSGQSPTSDANEALDPRKSDASDFIPYADPGIEVGGTTHRRAK